MKILKKIAPPLCIILGFAVAFSISEAVCRALHIPYNPAFEARENALAQFDPDLGWAYRPKYSVKETEGGRDIYYYFDANGIRVPRPNTVLDPKKPSVLFIGCSYTMGHSLPYEESFVGQFDGNGVPYQIVNLGVQAYGTDQALLALKKYLPLFNTKVVVYTFLKVHILRNGNYDRHVLFPHMRFIGTKPLFKLNREGKLYLAKKPVIYQEYIHSWFLDLIKITVGKKLGTLHPFPMELTRAMIKEMKAYAESEGAHFILLYWDWEFYDAFDRQQKNLNMNEFFKGLDIDAIYASHHAPPNWEKMRVKTSGHPNAAASQHVAKILLEYFREKNLGQHWLS